MLTVLGRMAQQSLNVIVITTFAAGVFLLLDVEVFFVVRVQQMLQQHVLLRRLAMLLQ